MYRVEEVFGPDGQVYLALRPEVPTHAEDTASSEEKDEAPRVIIIDMFETEFDNVYEF